jgi:hypothetical protein
MLADGAKARLPEGIKTPGIQRIPPTTRSRRVSGRTAPAGGWATTRTDSAPSRRGSLARDRAVCMSGLMRAVRDWRKPPPPTVARRTGRRFRPRRTQRAVSGLKFLGCGGECWKGGEASSRSRSRVSGPGPHPSGRSNVHDDPIVQDVSGDGPRVRARGHGCRRIRAPAVARVGRDRSPALRLMDA